jgi:hypothetical protein
MSINLDRIDRIEDYDEAIAALEELVTELVEEFVESPEGKAYLNAHPEMEEYVGSWIDHLLYYGYAYRSVTLPRMTKNEVEAIVTGLFPQKISLLDPEEAKTTIPELLAFWQFLKRAYKHKNATKIIKFLEQIQPSFKDIMNDSSRFGMAKSFFAAGIEAGFDMTSQEGLQAFQEQYNQSIREKTNNLSVPSGLETLLNNINSILQNAPKSASPPAELQNLLSLLKAAAGTSSGGTLSELAGAMLLEEGGDSNTAEPETADDFHRQVRASMWENAAEELPSLSPEAIAFLKQQTITETEPGTILRDFQTLLDFVGESGTPVSGKNHLLPQKSLTELNERLSEPIQLDLKRPQQKSYPPINGLYLLLRASGLGQIISKGKKPFLMLNPTILSSWNSLNPTERYFTLLEAWLLRADEEMLGERRSPLNEGTKCLHYWPRVPDKGQKIASYSEQQSLSYWPELHNLALMKLFGFIQIESAKPETGKGWRIKKIKRSPLGDALMGVVVRAFLERGMVWESEQNSAVSFGELQSALQPYFPQWQNNLIIPQHEFRSGVYIFKVSVGKIWRRIAISSQMTLADLSSLILESVDFDSDHLDMFIYKNQIGRNVEVSHPYADGSPSTNEVQIGDLPLAEGTSMTYIFDFGDWWEFDVQLEKIETETAKSNYAAIVDRHGESPPQYPDWEEWDED